MLTMLRQFNVCFDMPRRAPLFDLYSQAIDESKLTTQRDIDHGRPGAGWIKSAYGPTGTTPSSTPSFSGTEFLVFPPKTFLGSGSFCPLYRERAIPPCSCVQLAHSRAFRYSTKHLLGTEIWNGYCERSPFDLSKACASYLSRWSDTQTACALNRWHASRNGWQSRRD